MPNINPNDIKTIHEDGEYLAWLSHTKYPYPIAYLDARNQLHLYNKENIHFGLMTNVGDANLPLDKQPHVIFIDYDNQSLSEVTKDAHTIIGDYELGPCYILKSNKHKHYHLVSFTPVQFKKYLNILKSTDCCPKHVKFIQTIKHGTLRLSPKEEPIYLVKTISSPYPQYENLQLKESYFKLLHLEDKLHKTTKEEENPK